METIAATFFCLESLLTGAKPPKDIDIYCGERSNLNLTSFRDDFLINHVAVLETINAFIARADTLAKLHLDSMYVEKEQVRQRLQNQRVRAEKRLKELVFEILGEYAKTKIRIVRRKQFLQFDQNMKHAIDVWKLRWKRFCLKLSSDLFHSCGFKKIKDFNVVHCRLLSPDLNAEEMEYLTLKVNKKAGLLSSHKFDIVSVVKICYLGNTDPKNHLSNQNIQFAQTADELCGIFNSVIQWLAKTSNTAVVHDRTPSAFPSPLNYLLSTSGIDWMHISSLDPVFWERVNIGNRVSCAGMSDLNNDSAEYRQFLAAFTSVYSQQHSSCLFNSRVYFCLEDVFFSKYKSVAKNCVEELDRLQQLLDGLQSVYVNRNVDTAAVTNALNQCDTLSVVDLMCTSHQESDSVSGAVTAFPDVVKVKSNSGVTLHFACASVLHLLILQSARECNIDEGRRKLFTLTMKKTVKSLDDRTGAMLAGDDGAESGGGSGKSKKWAHLFVQPLQELAEQELVALYLKKDPSDGIGGGNSTPGPFLTGVSEKSAASAATSAAGRKVLSAFDLLPDHARLRESLGGSSSKLHCSYFLLGDDNTFGNFPGEVRFSEPHSCYYLLQVVNSDSKSGSASSLLSSSLGTADRVGVSLAQDNNFLHQLLHLYYQEGLKFPFCIQIKGDAATSATEAQKAPTSSRKTGASNSSGSSSGGGSTSARIAKDPVTGGGWDVNLLSTVCRWRSCLCDVPRNSSGSSSGFLCKYHDELRKSLERNSKGGSSDIAKYLPRKVPNFTFASGLDESKKDSMTIRAASTLLQELWDGKLGQTVKSFTKRMTVNMSLKHFLESSVTLYKNSYPTLSAQNLQAISTIPTWTRWNNKEIFERTVMDQNACLSLLNSILTLEQMISNEIQDFLALNIFPTAELSIIRKEIKAFRDHQEAAIVQQNGQRLNVSSSSPGKTAGEGDEGADGSGGGSSNPYEFVLAALNHEKTLCDRKLHVLATRKKEEALQRANAAAKKANKDGTGGGNSANLNNSGVNYNGREYKAFS